MSRSIAGVFDPRGPGAAAVAAALAPATANVYDDGTLVVGYTGEPQPPSGAPLCLLNGHIDNKSQLAEELRLNGERSAEETLRAGWQRWGEQLVERLRGDFVILIWDSESKQGVLARDQLGLRQLFTNERATTLCFATEVRELLRLLPSRPDPDRHSVAHWLAMSSRPGSATLYSGVQRLDPGTLVALSRQHCSTRTYWRPRYSEPTDWNAASAEELRGALALAVKRCVPERGRIGVLMSGGLDSASVAALASGASPGRVAAYSGVFPEHPAVDESILIEQLRTKLGLGGLNAAVRPGGLVASAMAAVATWEMPLRSWGDFWSLPLMRAAAQDGIELMLGGDGGDELFGTRTYLLADRVLAGKPAQAFALAHELPGSAYGPPRREVAALLGEAAIAGALPYGFHSTLRRGIPARLTGPAWLRRETARDLRESADPLAWKRLDGPRWWAKIAHGLTRGVEEVGLFEDRRRRAVAAGIDMRHPLFDLDLVERGLGLAPLASFDTQRNRPALRSSMAGLLPDAVLQNPRKAWFDSLIVDCLIGPDREAVGRLLGDPRSELAGYVDLDAVRRTLLESDKLRRERPFRWMWQVWRLLTAEIWLRAQTHAPDSSIFDLGASAPRLNLETTC